MGKSSIARAYEDWAHLDHQPFRVLVYLALRSLDEEAPPIYYAGWEEIARAANLPWDPEEPYVDHLDEAERKAVLDRRRRARKKYKNRVGELLKTLEEAGTVIRSGDAKLGTAQVVALTLDPSVTYTASQWTRRPRYRKNGAGQEQLIYEVRTPDWRPIPRQDPRPAVPSQGGPQGPSEGGPQGPSEGGPEATSERGPEGPSEAGNRSPRRGDPKRTHDPFQDPAEETGERKTSITSQPSPSTRVREPGKAAEDDLDLTPEQQKDRQVARMAEAINSGKWDLNPDDPTEDHA